MSENLTQIGVGGVFALLIIREVFGFLKRRNGNGKKQVTSGEQSPDFWIRIMEQAAEKGAKTALSNRMDELRRMIREELERR